MFKRRKPLTLTETGKQIFWPSMGWKRSAAYFTHRLLRVPASSRKIALGLAIGFGVSFTPLLGTHFVQAGILAYIMRANLFSAILGTFVGNPWTFAFFWWAGISFGQFMFGFIGIEGAAELVHGQALEDLWGLIWTDPMMIFEGVFLPWMLGGYLLCAISIPTSYIGYYYLVESAKKARRAARIKKKRLKRSVA